MPWFRRCVLCPERALKQFGHGPIVVVDEREHLLLQILNRCTRATHEHFTPQNAQADCNLTEPRHMRRGSQTTQDAPGEGVHAHTGRLLHTMSLTKPSHQLRHAVLSPVRKLSTISSGPPCVIWCGLGSQNGLPWLYPDTPPGAFSIADCSLISV